MAKEKTRITITVENNPLIPGSYQLNLWLGSGTTTLEWIPNCYGFYVNHGSISEGYLIEPTHYPIILKSNWKTNK